MCAFGKPSHFSTQTRSLTCLKLVWRTNLILEQSIMLATLIQKEQHKKESNILLFHNLLISHIKQFLKARWNHYEQSN